MFLELDEVDEDLPDPDPDLDVLVELELLELRLLRGRSSKTWGAIALIT